jgi:hypothetical protein
MTTTAAAMVRAVIAAYEDGTLPLASSSSCSQLTGHTGSVLDNYEEDLIFLELQSLARERSNDLIPFISAIFVGSQHISASATSRFGRLFTESIQFLRDDLLTNNLLKFNQHNLPYVNVSFNMIWFHFMIYLFI